MIWKRCVLLARQQAEEDTLGNPEYVYTEVKQTIARFTPWTDEQITLEGREITRNEQQFLIPVPYANFPICQLAELDGRRQEIVQATDLAPRFTLIRVKCYRG